MLKLDRRSVLMGPSINTRTQKHGEDNITALDIPLSCICLSSEELAIVMLNKAAYRFLYGRKKGRPDEPIFGSLVSCLKFKKKVEAVSAVLYLGRKQLRILDATLSKVTIEPQVGGVTWLSFTLQCTPDLDDEHPIMEALFSRLNEKIDLQIECEHYGAQPELPLEEEEEIDPEDEEDEDNEDDEDDTPAKGKGRKK